MMQAGHDLGADDVNCAPASELDPVLIQIKHKHKCKRSNSSERNGG